MFFWNLKNGCREAVTYGMACRGSGVTEVDNSNAVDRIEYTTQRS